MIKNKPTITPTIKGKSEKNNIHTASRLKVNLSHFILFLTRFDWRLFHHL